LIEINNGGAVQQMGAALGVSQFLFGAACWTSERTIHVG
jgi:hypothetical protein